MEKNIKNVPETEQILLKTSKSKRTLLNGDRISFFLLIGPPFIILFLLTVVPLFYSFFNSLFSLNLGMPDMKKFIALGNYLKMFSSDNFFWPIILNTVYQVFGTVIIQVVVGLLIALLLSREFKGVKLARSLYIIPMMATPVVIGIIWRMMLNPEFGIVNYLLSTVGITGPDWLGNPKLAMPAVIVSDIWLSTPFVAVIILAGIQSLPKEPFQAAKIDGASSFQIFRYITLPLLAPVIWIAILFRLMDAFKRFDSIYIMTAGGPGNVTTTLNIYSYMTAFTYMDVGYASALAMLMFIIIFLVSLFSLKRIQNTEDV